MTQTSTDVMQGRVFAKSESLTQRYRVGTEREVKPESDRATESSSSELQTEPPSWLTTGEMWDSFLLIKDMKDLQEWTSRNSLEEEEEEEEEEERLFA
ncbi:hypothetical protein D9C73_010645 [Collichthys lucidus]|uniref:Uncharacterized protein n=1 Tax=Collichthys lucidus TaxID=240159 RepID=A0A4U5UNJ9_COLLU|nr:hypothetical protein D9C73_010645 [Collichthys lucidus]